MSKTKENHSIKVTHDAYKQLKKLAQAQGRTITGQIKMLLLHYKENGYIYQKKMSDLFE